MKGFLMLALLALALLLLQCSGVYVPYYFEWNATTRAFENKTLPLPVGARAISPTFLTDAPPEAFRYQAQFHQDQICNELFKDKRDGYFVDLAAHTWRGGSNTYVLEAFNAWQGVCIEANPVDLLGLLGNRKCKLFTNPVGAKTGEVVRFDFRMADKKLGPGYGGIVGAEFDNQNNSTATELYTVTLADILEHARAPRIMDYLSLDIEGAEFYAMKNFAFVNYTFLMITVERPNRALHHLFTKNGYLFIAELTGDKFGECMYLHHSIDGLVQHIDKYGHKGTASPAWFGQPRPYLLHPKWNNSIHHYQAIAHKIAVEMAHPNAPLNSLSTRS